MQYYEILPLTYTHAYLTLQVEKMITSTILLPITMALITVLIEKVYIKINDKIQWKK